MITVALIAALTLATLLGGLAAWLVYGRVADVRALGDERQDHVATHARLERRDFEVMTLKLQLATETRRADVFEEALANAEKGSPNADLSKGDVRSRILRAASRARAQQASEQAKDPVAQPVAVDVGESRE